MDNFKEFLVKRQLGTKDYALTGLICLGVLVVSALAFALIPGFAFFITVAAIVAAYYFITGRNREFEYIITNGTLDIDVIKAKRSRKRLVSLNLSALEICAGVSDAVHKNRMQQGEFSKKIDSSLSSSPEGKYFAIFAKDGGRVLLFFNPPREMLEEMRVYGPSKLFI